MKKQLLGLLALTILYSACKKDETDPNQPPGPTLYLKSLINSSDSIVIDYNTDNTLKRHATYWGGQITESATHIYSPQYESGKPVSLYYSKDFMGSQGKLYQDFTYNSSGKLTKVTWKTSSSYDSLTYNDQGQLAERYYFIGPNDLNTSIKFTWENKNLVKVVETRETNTSVKTYKYDNKPNPLIMLTALTYPTFYYFHYLSANNVVESIYNVTYNNPAATTSTTTTYQYEFNAENYPVKMTTSSTSLEFPTPEIKETRMTYYPL